MEIQTVNYEELRSSWRQIVAKYRNPDVRRSLIQVVNSLIPYTVFYILMILSLKVSYWSTLLLALPTAGFMVRTFIIFHDCGHGSFFKSRKANDALGIITGIMTWTPYYHWRHDHAVHHATAGDLDRRGVGDVQTLTVGEYLALPWWRKLAYRIMRQPWIMFTIGASLVFIVAHRFWRKETAGRERWSVIYTNLVLLAFIILVSYVIGFGAFLMVQLPVMLIACSAGVWLFYVQHNFEDTYWERHEKWDYLTACVKGSSYYKLPIVLQWFSGNIGFHHIHHLSPKIPNYYLERCQRENLIFQSVKPLTLLSSLRSLRLRLWDEQNQRMVNFSELKMLNNALK